LSLSAISLMLAAPVTAEPPAAVHSRWVYPDSSGKLIYKPLESGDRIIDFSYAGYGGGGVALPTFPVKKTVAPPARTTPPQFNQPSTKYPNSPSSTE
jgi:hypothetical protein